jgi:hypothetical protein
VKLEVDGQEFVEAFEIQPDPRVDVSQKELEEQLALSLKVRDKLSETHDAIKRVRRVRGQIDPWVDRFKDQKDGDKIVESGGQMKERIEEIEGNLTQVKAKSLQDILNFPTMLNAKIGALLGSIGAADGAPTKQQYEVFDELSGRIDEQLEKLDEILEKDGKQLNKLIDKQGIDPISVN